MPPLSLRIAVGILLGTPWLVAANGTAPAAAAVSKTPAEVVPAPAPAPILAPTPTPVPAPAPTPVSNALPPPTPVEAGAGPSPAAADSSGDALPVTTPPATPSGWLPFVPIYTVPVWSVQFPLPAPIQPGTAPGGVAYVLMWVPVPLVATPPAAGAGAPPVQSGALPSATAGALAHVPEAPAPQIPAEAAVETARAVATSPSLTVSAQSLAAASVGAPAVQAPRAPLAAKVDYGPVAPTPVVYLRLRAGAPAVRPARVPAAVVAPAQRATRPAPKRRMCWTDGVVAPCR